MQDRTTLYAMPSLTRNGAAVLQAPADVVALLRTAYFRCLADHRQSDGSLKLPPDPTSYQRLETDKSPIYDGERLSSPHAVPRAGGAPARQVVEWAPVPEESHQELMGRLQPLLEAWCGHRLVPVRFFGVRRYLRGASLQSHVDSDPRVRAIGVSITVDIEGLEEPWPLVASGALGAPSSATLPVGECFVYEACRVRHHRPTPLRAAVFANAFAHFTLADW